MAASNQLFLVMDTGSPVAALSTRYETKALVLMSRSIISAPHTCIKALRT
jgi:hypothetical protein